MCDGVCTHTHLLHAHFFCTQGVHKSHDAHCAHSALLMRVNTHAWLQVMKKVSVSCACRLSLHLAFSTLMILHPLSLLLLHGHFETNLTDDTVRTVLPNFPDPKSAGQAHFRTSDEKFGYLAKSDLNTFGTDLLVKVARLAKRIEAW